MKVFQELFFCGLQIPPGVDFIIYVDSLGYELPYHVNNISVIFALMRWCYLVRALKVTARCNMHPKAKAVASIGDIDIGSWLFVYKDLMHLDAGMTLTVLGSVAVLSLSYLHRIAERSFGVGHDEYEKLNGTEYFTNSLWFVIVTIFTVGYGDMYTRTFAGRIVAILTMFVGLSFTSLFVAIVMEKTAQTAMERGDLS